MKNFENLLQSAEQLMPPEAGRTSGFIIQRTLSDLEEASRQLASRATRAAPDAAKSKASSYLLLASKGFDADRLPRELQSLRQLRPAAGAELVATTEQQQQQQQQQAVSVPQVTGAAALDVESYVRQAHDLLLLNAIEDAKRHSAARLEARAAEGLERDWNEARARLLHQLTQAPSPALMLTSSGDAGGQQQQQQQQQSQEMRQAAARWRGPSLRQSQKQLSYAKAVESLVTQAAAAANGAALRPATVVSAFADSAAKADDPQARRKQLADLWAQLGSMLEHLPSSSSSAAAAAAAAPVSGASSLLGQSMSGSQQQQQPPQQQQQAAATSMAVPVLSDRQRQALLLGARRFLEEQWRRWLEETVSRNLAQAQLGPRPSVRSFVQGWLRIKLGGPSPPPDYEVVEGADGRRAVWAELWMLLRCGAHNEAREVARELPGGGGVLQLLDDFLNDVVPSSSASAAAGGGREGMRASLAASRDGGLLLSTAAGGGSTGDPFKQAVLALLGGQVESARLSPTVQETTQDFLWVRLSGLGRAPGGPREALGRLQKLVARYGAAHFARQGREPLLYTAVLLATLQFSEAVEYVASSGGGGGASSSSSSEQLQLRVEAVHIAFALASTGLLPSAVLVRLVGHYVDDFAAAAPEDALHYWLLVHRLAPAADEWPRVEAGLAGALLARPGLFAELAPSRARGASSSSVTLLVQPAAASGGPPLLDDAKAVEVALAAAREAHALGRAREALELFLLIEEWPSVIELLESELAARVVPAAAAGGPVADPERTAWLQRAERLVQRAPWAASGQQQTRQQHRGGGGGAGGAGLEADEAAYGGLRLLLRLAYFFELARAARPLEALQVLEPLGLVPFEPGQALACAERFGQLPPSVQQVVPAVLEATADSLRRLVSSLAPPHQFAAVGRSLASDPARHQRVQELRQTSSALVTFVGLLHPRIPNGVVYVIKSLEMDLQM